jgi:Family of unknown function (DUF5317)
VTLALVFVVALASVPLAGGRLSALGELRLRSMWLAGLAFGVQVVLVTLLPDGHETVHRVAHLVTYALVGACLLRNLDLPFAWLVALGGALNLAAIAANGGVMPASAGALATAGLDPAGGGSFANSDFVEGARLAFLGDVFAIPDGWPGANVFSIGDVLLAAGALLALHTICGSRLGLLVRRSAGPRRGLPTAAPAPAAPCSPPSGSHSPGA